jgi:hypothetical protein
MGDKSVISEGFSRKLNISALKLKFASNGQKLRQLNLSLDSAAVEAYIAFLRVRL